MATTTLYRPVGQREYELTAASGYCGYVLRFRVPSEFLERYPARVVGERVHTEYWMSVARFGL